MLEQQVLEDLKARVKNRRVVNARVVMRVARKRLERLQEFGFDIIVGTEPWTPKQWWAYAFLHAHGFRSRRVGNKRTMGPGLAALLMRKHVKLQRRVVVIML